MLHTKWKEKKFKLVKPRHTVQHGSQFLINSMSEELIYQEICLPASSITRAPVVFFLIDLTMGLCLCFISNRKAKQNKIKEDSMIALECLLKDCGSLRGSIRKQPEKVSLLVSFVRCQWLL